MRKKPYPLDKYVYLFRNKKTGKVVTRYSEFLFVTAVAEHVMNGQDVNAEQVWERVIDVSDAPETIVPYMPAWWRNA